MYCNLKNFFVLFMLLSFGKGMMAQSISIPYFCGFEDEAENALWHMNTGTQGEDCDDQWQIGGIDYYEGNNSLTITNDGVNAMFGIERNVVIAYRKISIDTNLTVNISFDWKCEGIENKSQCMFYFLPASKQVEQNLYSLPMSSLPRIFENYTTYTPSGESVAGEGYGWKNCIADQRTLRKGSEFYMVFVWQNFNTDSSYNYSVSIDNIQITSASCPEPEMLEYTSGCDTLFIEWQGSNEGYEVQYKASEQKEWLALPPTTEENIVLPVPGEGVYDIRVRGLMPSMNDMSSWRYLTEAVCFCPDRHCINYVQLDREGVTCLRGSAKMSDILEETGVGTTGAGPIDKGAHDERSRHTVNWKKNVFDPRAKDPITGKRLSTIPPGSFASVRLGNWRPYTEAEGIIFDYVVDTAQADIILMKYAVVLEKPGHGPSGDPFFKVAVTDNDGVSLKGMCTDFDFTPENEKIQWYKCGVEGKTYVWKDWSAIGIDVSDRDGQNIKIFLTTRDCTFEAHGGYAYFTLDCIKATIKSTSCGSAAVMEMVAPDGFTYEWTRGEEREFVSNEASIAPPADDIETYYCELKPRDLHVDGDCAFVLQTKVQPRLPHAEFEWVHQPEGCQNKVVLKNKSCVYTRIDGVDTPTSEPCETLRWKVNDGTNSYDYIVEDFEVAMPNEGGKIDVKLLAYISGGACDDSTMMTIDVPAIYPHYEEFKDTICEGSYLQWGKNICAEAGVYYDSLLNIWGCDSVRVLHLTVVPPPSEEHINATICRGEVYDFVGEAITEPGEYRKVIPTGGKCDAVTVLHLQVLDPMGITIDMPSFVCADDDVLSVGYDFPNGMRKPMQYSVQFTPTQSGLQDRVDVMLDTTENMIDIELPAGIRPNSYTATFTFTDTASVCGDVVIPAQFDVRYSASMLQPKFNNFIAVQNAENNGGYEFVEGSYRWYKNDELMVGDTLPYLYLPEGQTFAADTCFYLSVVRVDDGVRMRTCEICPGNMTPNDDVFVSSDVLPVTLFDRGTSIVIDNVDKGVVMIHTLAGQLVGVYDVSSEAPEVLAPEYSGMYILSLHTADYRVVYKIQVR